jgi:hypothetical protein
MPWRGVVGCWLATPLLLAAAACLHTAVTARQVGPHTWPNMTVGDMSHSFWGSTGAHLPNKEFVQALHVSAGPPDPAPQHSRNLYKRYPARSHVRGPDGLM